MGVWTTVAAPALVAGAALVVAVKMLLSSEGFGAVVSASPPVSGNRREIATRSIARARTLVTESAVNAVFGAP